MSLFRSFDKEQFLGLVTPPKPKKARVEQKDIMNHWNDMKPLAESQLRALIEAWQDKIAMHPCGFIQLLEDLVAELRAQHKIQVDV